VKLSDTVDNSTCKYQLKKHTTCKYTYPAFGTSFSLVSDTQYLVTVLMHDVLLKANPGPLDGPAKNMPISKYMNATRVTFQIEV